MHWGGCRGGNRNGYQGGQREMPALQVDTGMDNGGWVLGCRCPEMPVRRVGTGMGTEPGIALGIALGTGGAQGAADAPGG